MPPFSYLFNAEFRIMFSRVCCCSLVLCTIVKTYWLPGEKETCWPLDFILSGVCTQPLPTGTLVPSSWSKKISQNKHSQIPGGSAGPGGSHLPCTWQDDFENQMHWFQLTRSLNLLKLLPFVYLHEEESGKVATAVLKITTSPGAKHWITGYYICRFSPIYFHQWV